MRWLRERPSVNGRPNARHSGIVLSGVKRISVRTSASGSDGNDELRMVGVRASEVQCPPKSLDGWQQDW
jgi:hypothetical protein